jgi:hypothetical protein
MLGAKSTNSSAVYDQNLTKEYFQIRPMETLDPVELSVSNRNNIEVET